MTIGNQLVNFSQFSHIKFVNFFIY